MKNQILPGQIETKFDPNPLMLKLLEAAIDPEVEATVTSWCEASGVSRAQYYRWKSQEGFLEWFNGEYKKALDGIRVALLKVGLQKALEGDFQFWKVMMEKTGEYTQAMNHRVKGEQTVIINITQTQADAIHEGAILSEAF